MPASGIPTIGPLRGKTIALPESRELDRLAAMLAVEGASTLRCPLISILDAKDSAPIYAWLEQLAHGQFTDVIFLTGEGVRRLWLAAGRQGMQESVKQGLLRVRKITRGPKPARALHEIGLSPDVCPVPHTSVGIIRHLETERPELGGRIFGVQLYGDDPGAQLVTFLRGCEARVHTVSPYVYAAAADDARVCDLIDSLAEGHLDAIAFTSAPQVERLWQVAERQHKVSALLTGLRRVTVAAVGPIVAQTLSQRGRVPDVVPTPQFFMRRLTEALVERLRPQP